MNEFLDYILVLPSWYPSRVNIFNGDFNERLVHAVSKYRKQIVVYVVQDNSLVNVFVEITEQDNIITYIIYYQKKNNFIYTAYQVFKLYLSTLNSIFNIYGKPKLAHIYVFYPAGLISLYLKYKYGLKTILTEHWTIFYKEQKHYINNHHFLKKLLYRKVLVSFDIIITVANRLKNEISKWSGNNKKCVIPNVVDTRLFNFDNNNKENDKPFKFIHVSTLGYQKNINGILNVMENIVNKTNIDMQLVLIGTYNSEVIKRISNSASLSQYVSYVGEIPYHDVAKEMKRSDAFILFSRYENMPCVLLESLCCGLPIISSKVGGIAEIINEENGILVENENEEQLEQAIFFMMNNYSIYDREKIAEKSIKKYNYNKIGEEIIAIYEELENL
ncbi:glycosyl transferase group 1 [Pseudopedobacter saltans DSM 12145]|uniref:Glycosyl transferase group 1 n=1 Tax=Pseudopedobacter saltans (strain ATCC 51119 / DSM 12145 / JCM 21818 / CCUG 39354 / LMG 10337 / NBRC 100064 / NCIMB 13643) TaxID=762903 RepID=F0SD26_PSESL|nr:glycosyltransferase [Pseudopedobacter saltans]ADY51783.1 glycosyl transferase group 1 [Pseudopedobacter saltans DSM 12145]